MGQVIEPGVEAQMIQPDFVTDPSVVQLSVDPCCIVTHGPFVSWYWTDPMVTWSQQACSKYAVTAQ